MVEFNAVYDNSTLKNEKSLQEVFLKYIYITLSFCNPNQSSMQPGSPKSDILTTISSYAQQKQKISYFTIKTKILLTSYSYIRNYIYLQLRAEENARIFLTKMQQILQWTLKQFSWCKNEILKSLATVCYRSTIAHNNQLCCTAPSSFSFVNVRHVSVLNPCYQVIQSQADIQNTQNSSFLMLFLITTGSFRGPAI